MTASRRLEEEEEENVMKKKKENNKTTLLGEPIFASRAGGYGTRSSTVELEVSIKGLAAFDMRTKPGRAWPAPLLRQGGGSAIWPGLESRKA